MTRKLFLEDAYQRVAPATIVAVRDDGVIELDQTLFYAQGGGQPGDTGLLVLADGTPIRVAASVYSPDRLAIWHRCDAIPAGLSPGDRVEMRLDWAQRYDRMRVHTALHLLTAVLPYPVTGGAIGEGEGRLDFDIPDAGLDKQVIGESLNALIARKAVVTSRWISDEALLANPGLVKTMSVKPPMGTGQVRLVDIAGLDLQPCGGTHVANTGEIGAVEISDIEKKGKQNRRVRMRLAVRSQP